MRKHSGRNYTKERSPSQEPQGGRIEEMEGIKPHSPLPEVGEKEVASALSVEPLGTMHGIARRAQPKESTGKASNADQSSSSRSARVGKTAATLTLVTGEEKKEYTCGGRISLPLEIDGQQMDVLVDTGSLVTIISLSALLKCWRDG